MKKLHKNRARTVFASFKRIRYTQATSGQINSKKFTKYLAWIRSNSHNRPKAKRNWNVHETKGCVEAARSISLSRTPHELLSAAMRSQRYAAAPVAVVASVCQVGERQREGRKANALVNRFLVLSGARTLHRFVYSGNVNGTGSRFDVAYGIPSEWGNANRPLTLLFFCGRNECLRALSAYGSWSSKHVSIVCKPVDTFFPSLSNIAYTVAIFKTRWESGKYQLWYLLRFSENEEFVQCVLFAAVLFSSFSFHAFYSLPYAWWLSNGR